MLSLCVYVDFLAHEFVFLPIKKIFPQPIFNLYLYILNQNSISDFIKFTNEKEEIENPVR